MVDLIIKITSQPARSFTKSLNQIQASLWINLAHLRKYNTINGHKRIQNSFIDTKQKKKGHSVEVSGLPCLARHLRAIRFGDQSILFLWLPGG